MGSYYYLMAQLPYLMYDQKPPMSSEAFKELAGSLLSKKDASLIKYVSIEAETGDAKKTGCKFIDNWRSWKRTLFLNLAKSRSIKLYNEKPEVEVPVIPYDAFGVASLVFSQEGTPLDGEILLDKARWNVIDLLAGSNYFDRNNVYAYLLKLLLLERRQLFNTEKGFNEYKSVYAEIINSSQDYSGGV